MPVRSAMAARASTRIAAQAIAAADLGSADRRSFRAPRDFDRAARRTGDPGRMFDRKALSPGRAHRQFHAQHGGEQQKKDFDASQSANAAMHSLR